jgi:hypothetical protein
MDAAAAAAKEAKLLSKTLPKKDAKKLKSVAAETKDVAKASKKKVARRPNKVERQAIAAIARLDKAVDKAEAGLAARRKAAAKAKAKQAKQDAKSKQREKSSPSAQEGGTAPEPSLYETPRPDSAYPSEVPSASPAAAEGQDLSSLTVRQLRERARTAGHAGFSRYTKAQLMALLSS